MARFFALVIVGTALGFATGHLPTLTRLEWAYIVGGGFIVLAVRVLASGHYSDDNRLYRRMAKLNRFGGRL